MKNKGFKATIITTILFLLICNYIFIYRNQLVNTKLDKSRQENVSLKQEINQNERYIRFLESQNAMLMDK